MSPREALHRLVEEMPEDRLPIAENALHGIRNAPDPLSWVLEHAPLDDEPETPEEAAAVAEALRDIAEGRVISHEEVKRRWGIG